MSDRSKTDEDYRLFTYVIDNMFKYEFDLLEEKEYIKFGKFMESLKETPFIKKCLIIYELFKKRNGLPETGKCRCPKKEQKFHFTFMSGADPEFVCTICDGAIDGHQDWVNGKGPTNSEWAEYKKRNLIYKFNYKK